MRRQIALLPQDSDAYFALGNALRSQERPEDALKAYNAAVAITPTDYESHLGRAGVLASLERYSEEVDAYRAALRIRPEDVKVWINVGVALSRDGGRTFVTLMRPFVSCRSDSESTFTAALVAPYTAAPTTG